jgi:spore germination cell wall hydrolase CwlJ-like protein
MVLQSALLCLAINVWHEARSEPRMGQYAVAQVVLNRAGGDQRQVCKEVYRKRQFSWTHQRVRFKKPEKVDPAAWALAKDISYAVLSQPTLMNVVVKGADHYHATYVSPQWGKQFQVTYRVGNHIFYRS